MVSLNEIYTVEIEDTNIFANGICHIDSFVVFVENTLKGEKCKIQITKVHPRFAYAKCIEYITLSPQRITPPCDKYEKCGGCSFLHTTQEYENQTKLNFVKSVFAKNKIEAEFSPAICPVAEKYRNKIVLFYNGQGFGYNEKSTNRIVEHKACLLNESFFDKIADFTAKNLRSTPLRALYLRKNRDNTEIMVCPIFYKPTNVIEYATKLLAQFPNVKTVLTSSLSDRDFAIEKLAFKTVYGDGYITDFLCGLSFKISPRSFYQINPDCAEMLYEKAIELLNPQPSDQIADLFCGTGTMGIITAKRTKCNVYGIEIEPSAVRNAKQNAKLNGVTNIEFKAEDASKFDKKIDSCIIDPPRKGCSKLMLDTLLRLKPQKIVYVSCNPDTMCNDLKVLLNEYTISSPIYTYNQFPRTSHTESVVSLTLKNGTTSYMIREIQAKDNKQVENVIRTCLIEFGANHEGTAWADPDLGRFSEIYNTEGNKYWVIENENGKILGGVGIGSLEGTDKICELQKMYCLPEIRGTGLSHKLMNIALAYARGYYKRCYLETLPNMIGAQKFYEKYGFTRIYEPVIKTDHFACDVLYIKDL